MFHFAYSCNQMHIIKYDLLNMIINYRNIKIFIHQYKVNLNLLI